MKLKNLTLILLLSIVTISCNEDNESEQQPEPEVFLCCGENPFELENIDNLDQSAGELNVVPIFTPNGDGYHDTFWIENIDLYPNNSLTLYDINDNVVFTIDNYGINNLYGGFLNIENGTLKYKIVIENEQTFVEFGYVCVVTGIGESDDDFSFYNECSLEAGYFDPLIGN
ncbi:gliding motility-associated C-terminal domain-containing protein [Psychroserpens mesophilus]|uniref:T9SS type B sorting domain-containing protein n=1 Tax=Psychroserpens mesophilus TaxID=325473 RepID=UPI003D64F320